MAYEVFISFKRNALDGSGLTRDYQLADDLHKTLKAAGVETFMSEKDVYVSDFRRQIDDALDEAKILIAVGTSKENMESENVRYEWWSFNNDILSGDKPDGQIFSYIEGMSRRDLPRALRRLQFYTASEKERLVAVVLKNLGKTVPEPKPVSFINLRVGDRVPFGKYPQGANGEVESLMWRVLAVESGRALLITDKLIDCVRYHETDTKVTWETCSLRSWMNNVFIRKAFSSEELAHIATVTIPNLNRDIFGLKEGNPTSDKIFALSIDEAKKYFHNDNDRMAARTGYAKKQGCWTRDNYSLPTGEKPGWWWLRSPGYYCSYAANVDSFGFVFQLGFLVDDFRGAVRPAFWLNL